MTVIDIGNDGVQASVHFDDEKDVVRIEYWGDAPALVAAGLPPELVRPGTRGKRRVDCDGDCVRVCPMNNHWTRVRILFREKSLKQAMRMPGLGIGHLLGRFVRGPAAQS